MSGQAELEGYCKGVRVKRVIKKCQRALACCWFAVCSFPLRIYTEQKAGRQQSSAIFVGGRQRMRNPGLQLQIRGREQKH